MEKAVTTVFGCHDQNLVERTMNRPEYYVGVDIASASFTSAVGRMEDKWHIVVKPAKFTNDYDSFPQFMNWLLEHGMTSENCIICMEATGVYCEALAHFLLANNYQVSIEPPLDVKRAFPPEGHKNDPVDSCQISEYAYRFWDELSLWAPRTAVLEQIKILLTTREQFVVEKTSHINSYKALQKKVTRSSFAEELHKKAIVDLTDHIKNIEAEIKRLINEDPDLIQTNELLQSIPGVGLLLAAQMLVLYKSSPSNFHPKKLAAYIGICPYDDLSGTSVHHKSTSRHYGPPGLRKLLFLASLSISTHNANFRSYYLRKVQEGKPKHVVTNNVANKLLKVIVAVLRTKTKFIDNYRSVNPRFLKSVLTKS
jgi:transposase